MRYLARLATVALVTLAISALAIVILRQLETVMPSWCQRLGSVPFYSVWLAIIAIYTVAWPEQAATVWRVHPSAWSRRDWAIIATISGLALWMYGPAITTVFTVGASPLRLDFLGGVVLAPVVEEWVFRGLVWTQLETISASPRRGLVANLIVGSLIFGLFHLSFEGASWIAFGNVFVHAAFGFLIGLLRWRTRSVFPGVLVHTIGNLFARLAAA